MHSIRTIICTYALFQNQYVYMHMYTNIPSETNRNIDLDSTGS